VKNNQRLAAMAAVMMAAAVGGWSNSSAGPGLAGSPWDKLLAATRAPGDWVTYGGTFDEQRFSRLTQISDRNVARLGLAWSYEFDTNRAQETTPLEYNGVIYATTAWSKVVALDAKTGKRLWSYDPQVPGEFGAKGCCDVGNRGSAIYDGKLFFGTLDGRLIALNLKTGKPVWSVVTVDQSKTYTITGAPRIVKGKVLIGNGGAELGARGYVTAYDAQTGKQVWRFYTVPGNPADGPDHAASDKVLAEKANGTWFGEYWKTGGGMRSSTIRSSTSFTSASATAARGTTSCAARARATISSFRRSSRSSPIPANISGIIRARRAKAGITPRPSRSRSPRSRSRASRARC
jgi:quinohemoprotein ethanol dehydrogenase